jgi:hypothetical protein
MPPAVPPAFAVRAGYPVPPGALPRDDGRVPGRPTGRSRVVRQGALLTVPASSHDRGSLWSGAATRVPIDALLRVIGGRHWTRTSDLLHVKQVL